MKHIYLAQHITDCGGTFTLQECWHRFQTFKCGEKISILTRSKGFDKSCQMKFSNNLICKRRLLLGKFWWKDEEFLGRSIVRWLAARQSPFDIKACTAPAQTFVFPDRRPNLPLWYQFIVLSCFSPSQWETLPPIFLLIGLFLFSRRVLLFHLPPHYKQHLYNDTAATNNGLSKSLKIQRNKTCCQHLKYKRNTKHMLTRASFMIGLKAVILSLQVGLFIHSCFWVISGECSFSSFPFLPIFLFLFSGPLPPLGCLLCVRGRCLQLRAVERGKAGHKQHIHTKSGHQYFG